MPAATRSRKALAELIDEGVSARDSLLLRYHRVLERLRLDTVVDLDTLAACTIAEGADIRPLTEYRGVEIVLCDESSLMCTGTYKDLDAAFITAVATYAGLESVVVSSGGNLGYSLARYCRRSRLGLYFFNPVSTLYKLDRNNFDWHGVKLIAADCDERAIKKIARAFAFVFGVTHVPDVRWRLAASASRAMFILEHLLVEGGRIDWIAQTMCAGYGPAGIYSCFSELEREGVIDRQSIPRFFGFQQDTNAPMVHAWRAGMREIAPQHVHPEPSRYLEPGLYNTEPADNYTRLHDLLRYFGGDMAAVTADDYRRYAPMVEEWLAAAGFELTRLPGSDEPLERTGIITGVGIAREIDTGTFAPGDRVLYLMTGGSRKVGEMLPPEPAVTIDASRSPDRWIAELGERFGLRRYADQRRADRLFHRQ